MENMNLVPSNAKTTITQDGDHNIAIAHVENVNLTVTAPPAKEGNLVQRAFWGDVEISPTEAKLLDEFFNDFTRPSKSLMRYQTPTSNVMRTDIKETQNGYELDIDLPGYKKSDVQAELKEGYLTISASTRKDESEKDKDGKYLRRERYYGSCSRSFYVGDAVTQEDIKARFEDGILKVTVPKKEVKPQVEESKYIAIEG